METGLQFSGKTQKVIFRKVEYTIGTANSSGSEPVFVCISGDAGFAGETGLYYYGARCLDLKTSRWLSADPAVGDYLPGAPVSGEARRRNGSLPGQGGVFNLVNLHVYHYAGNNPVKYVDPDGRTPQAVVKAAQAAGPAAPVVLGVGIVVVIATDPEARQGIANGVKVAWDGIGKLGSILMAASDKLKEGIAGAVNSSTSGASAAQPSPEQDPNNKPKRTDHGEKRYQEGQNGNPHRNIGDANRTINEGNHYIDSETGYDVYIRGNKGIIVKDGSIHSQFHNTAANTAGRVTSGKWVPVE